MKKLFLSAISIFLFLLSASAQDNASTVCRSNDSLRVTRLRDKLAIPYWTPSDTQFVLLKENVKIVIQHENEYDTADSSKEERQFFLEYLDQWSNRTYDCLFRMVNGCGVKDVVFYYELQKMIRYSDAGNFSKLQLSLLGHWEKHGAEIKLFWTPDVLEAYLSSRKNLKNTIATSAMDE
jgi:hypothetical protein